MNQIAKVEEICNETGTSNKMEKLQTNSSKEKEVQIKKNQRRLFIWSQGLSVDNDTAAPLPPPWPLLRPGLSLQQRQGSDAPKT